MDFDRNVEFQENEALRILSKCSNAFHINCIDVWLRSHANCPLCRANIMYLENPFVPAMSSRIRPSLEHGMAGLCMTVLDKTTQVPMELEIVQNA